MTNLLNTWASVQEIRRRAPVVHNITNYVVMNNTANALLALGASPVMAHAEEEMAEMVALSAALVINIGTLSAAWIRSMFAAAEHACKRGIPIVLVTHKGRDGAVESALADINRLSVVRRKTIHLRIEEAK